MDIYDILSTGFFINGKYRDIYVAELIQLHCPYCHSHNLKHNGHYTSNVHFITADANHPVKATRAV